MLVISLVSPVSLPPGERTPLFFSNRKQGELDTTGLDFSEKGKIASPCRAPNRESSIIHITLFRRSFKYRSLFNCLLCFYIILGWRIQQRIYNYLHCDLLSGLKFFRYEADYRVSLVRLSYSRYLHVIFYVKLPCISFLNVQGELVM